MSTPGEMLIGALRGEELPAGAATLALLELARHHNVVLLLDRAYGASAPDSLIRSEARRRRAEALRLTLTAVEVSGWLDAARVTHALVKGPALAAAYPTRERSFTDIDVLVTPDEMPRAIEALCSHGAKVVEPVSWPREDGIGEIPFGLASGVTVDLHAELIHKPDVRRQFRLDSNSLLSRRATTTLLGTPVPVLDAEDTLIHVALHAMLSGGDRLAWLADLDVLVRHGAPDWDQVLARSASTRLALVVGVMLERAVIVLGTPVPRSCLRALTRRGRAWATLLRLYVRAWPIAGGSTRYGSGQILIRATRHSTVTSLWALARMTWSEVIVFVVRDPSHPWREEFRRRIGATAVRMSRWKSR